jgi:chitin synthase
MIIIFTVNSFRIFTPYCLWSFREADDESYQWDIGLDEPPPASEDSKTPRKIVIGIKCMKIAAYILTFLLVLGSATIAVGTFLFMTSQLSIGQNVTICAEKPGV